MRKITALRTGRGRGKQLNIFLDGKFAFSLEAEVATRAGLQVEQILAADQIEALAKADQFHRCLKAAFLHLSHRPRSESELREKFRQRGFDGDTQEAVIVRLKELGLVDDTAFAQFWTDNRQSFSPRSRWLTRLELRQKGVANDIIEQAVGNIGDDDSAYRAALGKVRSLPRSDFQSFRHRLGGYLKRRGFSYQVINNTVERIWQDQVSSTK